jgi:acetoin utilization deacetylase AcuC-like enzyme
MKLFSADQFTFPLPEGHRFPAAKYRLLRPRVEESGLFAPEDIVVPHAATDEELLRVHSPEYLRKLCEGSLSDMEQRRIGLPWSPELVERSRRSTGATIEACRSALLEGIAVNLAGGTHHAFRDAGEGFCVFNDCGVAARAMQAEGRVQRVVIIDLDVHQGNGTAAIFQGDDSVFTFSVHGARNFPARKETSDLDIELPDDTADAEYLEAVEQGVWEALHRARAELAIYLAGADPFEGDRLGRMKVTKAGLARRSEIVFEACSRERLPVAVTMAGGYGHDIRDTVDVNFQTVWLALEWWRRWHGAG